MPRRPWTPAEIVLLGTLPDNVVAVRVGRTPQAVSDYRKRHGIKPVKMPRLWTDVEISLLGKLPDIKVAAQIGRHRLEVQRKRLRLKIPSVKKKTNWNNTMIWKSAANTS